MLCFTKLCKHKVIFTFQGISNRAAELSDYVGWFSNVMCLGDNYLYVVRFATQTSRNFATKLVAHLKHCESKGSCISLSRKLCTNLKFNHAFYFVEIFS